MNILSRAARIPLPLLAALLSIGALAVALTSQYAFGLYPCHLCILQRYPHIAIIALAALSLAAKKHARLFAVVAACLLLANAGVGIYHAGVEKGIFAGPSSCTSGNSGSLSIEELRAQILAAPVTFCDEPAFEVMGLTMASLHAIYCAAGALLLFWLLTRRKDDAPAGT